VFLEIKSTQKIHGIERTERFFENASERCIGIAINAGKKFFVDINFQPDSESQHGMIRTWYLRKV
jgi:hypothetical protein